MANVYLNLPAPAGNGVGAWVDVSTMGADKTIIVGGSPRATVNVEISNEAAPSQGAPVATFKGNGKQTVSNAAWWARIRVTDYKSGTIDCEVGANDDGANFASLPVTAGDGTGVAVDVSALGGIFKTITVMGPFRGSTIIELSEDNVSWGQSMVFPNSPRQQSKIVTAQFMRVRRTGVPTIAPGLPIVNVGVISDVTPGPSFTDPELIRYTATGAEGSTITVPITARANANYFVALMSQSQIPQSGKAITAIPRATRTVNDFVAELDAPAELDDQWEFLVVGG